MIPRIFSWSRWCLAQGPSWANQTKRARKHRISRRPTNHPLDEVRWVHSHRCHWNTSITVDWLYFYIALLVRWASLKLTLNRRKDEKNPSIKLSLWEFFCNRTSLLKKFMRYVRTKNIIRLDIEEIFISFYF